MPLLRQPSSARWPCSGDADADEVTVVVTRTHARSFGLEEGSTVWLTPADGAIVIPRMAAAV